MQTVTGLFTSFGAAASTGAAAMTTSSALSAASFGTSALSALSGYAMSQSKAATLDLESGAERLAARGDYLAAQQKTNEINRQFNQVIGAQLADASADGIDIGSGSVQEAGYQAAQQRDRVVRAAQNTAEVDARLRTARAGMLDASARITRTTGVLSAITDVAGAALRASQVGGD